MLYNIDVHNIYSALSRQPYEKMCTLRKKQGSFLTFFCIYMNRNKVIYVQGTRLINPKIKRRVKIRSCSLATPIQDQQYLSWLFLLGVVDAFDKLSCMAVPVGRSRCVPAAPGKYSKHTCRSSSTTSNGSSRPPSPTHGKKLARLLAS